MSDRIPGGIKPGTNRDSTVPKGQLQTPARWLDDMQAHAPLMALGLKIRRDATSFTCDDQGAEAGARRAVEQHRKGCDDLSRFAGRTGAPGFARALRAHVRNSAQCALAAAKLMALQERPDCVLPLARTLANTFDSPLSDKRPSRRVHELKIATFTAGLEQAGSEAQADEFRRRIAEQRSVVDQGKLLDVVRSRADPLLVYWAMGQFPEHEIADRIPINIDLGEPPRFDRESMHPGGYTMSGKKVTD